MIAAPTIYTKLQSLIANIFFAVCMPLAFYGFQKTQNIELRPALDILFFLLLTVSIARIGRPGLRKIQVHLAATFAISLFYIINTLVQTGFEVHTLPTLKVFFYIIFLLFVFTSKSSISQQNLNRIIYLFLILATIKYAVSITSGLNYRPLFFTENNFEVILYIIIFLYQYHYNIEGWLKYLAVALVIMSGSASGALSLISAISVLQVKKNPITLFFVILMIGSIMLLILIPKFSGGLEAIDRYAYLLSGITTLSERNWFEILFGPGFAKPLSIDSCMQLSYIKAKVSYNFTCYSNALSIGVLRYIIDFGILGTIYITYLIFRLLRLSGYKTVFTLSVLTAIVLNGISVSGFSNQFSILALLVLLLKAKEQINKKDGS